MSNYTLNCIHYQVCQRSSCHTKCQYFEEKPKLTDGYKCVICKYRGCWPEKPCRECSRSWADLYEEAEK